MVPILIYYNHLNPDLFDDDDDDDDDNNDDDKSHSET